VKNFAAGWKFGAEKFLLDANQMASLFATAML